MRNKILTTSRDVTKVALTRYPHVYDRLRLPYSVVRFKLKHLHDPDYGVFGLFPQSRGVFLDVGANAGMSALSFRVNNVTTPIVSIEPNPFHEADLRFVGRLAKPFAYRILAAGAEHGQMTLHVPIYRDVPLTTEASLLLDEVKHSNSLRARLGERMDTDDFRVVPCDVPVSPLDALNLDPAFVKLDVQGFEHDALCGMRETLQRCRPPLLVETPDNNVREFLDGLNYEAFTYRPDEHRLVPETTPRSNTVFATSDTLTV